MIEVVVFDLDGTRGHGKINVLPSKVMEHRVGPDRTCLGSRPVLVVGAGARVADVARGGLDRISGRHTLNGTLTQPLRTVTSLRHGRGTI